MKIYITALILNLIAISTIGQKLTKITGFIPEAIDSSFSVQLYVSDPTIIKTDKYTMLEMNTDYGYFSFDFKLDTPSMAVLNINGRNILSPGVDHLLIEPADSLNFYINNTKNPGLMNVNITGKGMGKVDFTKAIISKIFPIYKTDQTDLHRQSVNFRFETTDKKLNVIDSVYNSFNGVISGRTRDIIAAYEYHYTLDVLLLSARNSASDSLRYLFNKYIIKKNRMDKLLSRNIVNYYPYHVIGNFILLSEFINPSKEIEVNFIQDRPMDFARLIVKYFQDNKAIKEFLLADLVVKKLKTEMLSDNSRRLFEFYNKNVSRESCFYREVQDLYKYFSSNLSIGKPFYKFELVDTIGNIHRLDDFRGKVLVLDFWFYGCAGCAQVTRVLDSLEDCFAKEKIHFVSIGIDTKNTWLKGIGKYSSVNSLNLYTNELGSEHPLIKYLNFSTYPRLVVIDPKGNMVGTPPDPRKNKEEFVRFINSL